MKANEIYNDSFYRERDKKTRETANTVLGILLSEIEAHSAVDVGCGVGTWLDVFQKLTGSVTIDGYDGDYVNPEYLQIPQEAFHAVDLNNRLFLKDKYDLAISLEVAEHLRPERAEAFVEDLCSLSDIVLFSAATKNQGGDGHINEQRLSYWIELFDRQGYHCFDVIRPFIWEEKQIPVWYRNNIVVMARPKKAPKHWKKMGGHGVMDFVHPDLYESKTGVLSKTQSIVHIYQMWLDMYERGDTIDKLLREFGVNTVAIYGMAEIGERLYKELRDTDIHVCYGIDHYKRSHPSLKLYDYTDNLPRVDAIIVTPIDAFDEICNALRKHGISVIIYGIDDLIKC